MIYDNTESTIRELIKDMPVATYEKITPDMAGQDRTEFVGRYKFERPTTSDISDMLKSKEPGLEVTIRYHDNILSQPWITKQFEGNKDIKESYETAKKNKEVRASGLEKAISKADKNIELPILYEISIFLKGMQHGTRGDYIIKILNKNEAYKQACRELPEIIDSFTSSFSENILGENISIKLHYEAENILPKICDVNYPYDGLYITPEICLKSGREYTEKETEIISHLDEMSIDKITIESNGNNIRYVLKCERQKKETE